MTICGWIHLLRLRFLCRLTFHPMVHLALLAELRAGRKRGRRRFVPRAFYNTSNDLTKKGNAQRSNDLQKRLFNPRASLTRCHWAREQYGTGWLSERIIGRFDAGMDFSPSVSSCACKLKSAAVLRAWECQPGPGTIIAKTHPNVGLMELAKQTEAPMLDKRIALVVWLFAVSVTEIAYAQGPGALEFGTAVVKELHLGDLLNKIFDKFLQDKTPKEAARPKIRELYSSLLDVKDKRETLLTAIQQRKSVLSDPNADADARALDRDEVIKSASKARTAFVRLQKAFTALNVDLDSTDPELSTAFGRFITAQQPIYVVKSINVDDPRALEVARLHLIENRSNLQDALKRLRELTHKVYPDFGELLSPGILR